MKKKIEVTTPNYEYIEVCDYCGGESLQDELVRHIHDWLFSRTHRDDSGERQLICYVFAALFGGDLYFHGQCFVAFRKNIRKTANLKGLEE